MNRIEIKEKAKALVKENFKNFWIGYLTILGITFLCALFIQLLFSNHFAIYNFLTLVASFFTSTLSVGFYSYILKMTRQEEYKKEEIFCFVKDILPITAIGILMMVFTFLWGILLIIPGVIAALSYSMVFYLYIENKERSPMEYLTLSKEMMKGYKWNYFVFAFSFLGWIFLSIITLGIALIWTIPYIIISQTVYYDELKKLKEKE